jgi:hypothetical protein
MTHVRMAKWILLFEALGGREDPCTISISIYILLTRIGALLAFRASHQSGRQPTRSIVLPWRFGPNVDHLQGTWGTWVLVV